MNLYFVEEKINVNLSFILRIQHIELWVVHEIFSLKSVKRDRLVLVHSLFLYKLKIFSQDEITMAQDPAPFNF